MSERITEGWLGEDTHLAKNLGPGPRPSWVDRGILEGTEEVGVTIDGFGDTIDMLDPLKHASRIEAAVHCQAWASLVRE